jgi:hypothetical protein
MSAADIAHALGDARREGRTWRCRYVLHGRRSLILCNGDGGRLLVWCSAATVAMCSRNCGGADC